MQNTVKTNKLLEAENRLKELRASAMNGATDETVDLTAAELGMTRRELVSYAIKHLNSKSPYFRFMTVNCTLRTHAVLQRVIKELYKIGFRAVYQLDFMETGYSSISFGISIIGDGESTRFRKLYKVGALFSLSPSIQTNLQPDEFDLFYEHLTGSDETPMRDALSEIDAWAKSLREKDKDLLTAISKLLY